MPFDVIRRGAQQIWVVIEQAHPDVVRTAEQITPLARLVVMIAMQSLAGTRGARRWPATECAQAFLPCMGLVVLLDCPASAFQCLPAVVVADGRLLKQAATAAHGIPVLARFRRPPGVILALPDLR